ncbi:MAG TPA: hypothetical protein VN689_09260, partial [Burkholderiales bacterium]|nr:hypothetical protein [Burkholderiales bacterium]
MPQSYRLVKLRNSRFIDTDHNYFGRGAREICAQETKFSVEQLPVQRLAEIQAGYDSPDQREANHTGYCCYPRHPLHPRQEWLGQS